MKRTAAKIEREYGPFPGVDRVHGVTYDGRHVWFASGAHVNALDPATGEVVRVARGRERRGHGVRRHLPVPAGRVPHPESRPGHRPSDLDDSGARQRRRLGAAWAEGALWVGHYRERRIYQGRSRDRRDLADDRVESLRHRRHVGRRRALARHVGGRRERAARRIDPADGRVLASVGLPAGAGCRGSMDGGDRFFCGGGASGTIRALRKPPRTARARAPRLERVATSAKKALLRRSAS